MVPMLETAATVTLLIALLMVGALVWTPLLVAAAGPATVLARRAWLRRHDASR
jgi:hypothetical protein